MDSNQKPYGLIYKTTNLINSKIYIGQTIHIQQWESRKYIGSGKYFKSTVKKYGKENFKSEIICYASNQQELNDLEIKYISEFNSIVPNGYNLKLGGHQGGKSSDLAKERISNSLKGNKYRLGIPHTQNQKELISSRLKESKKNRERIEKIKQTAIERRQIKYKVISDSVQIVAQEAFQMWIESTQSNITVHKIISSLIPKYKILAGQWNSIKKLVKEKIKREVLLKIESQCVAASLDLKRIPSLSFLKNKSPKSDYKYFKFFRKNFKYETILKSVSRKTSLDYKIRSHIKLEEDLKKLRGRVIAKDNLGNRIITYKTDPRWISGELVGITKNIKFSASAKEKLKGYILAIDKFGNHYRVQRTDPRWISGELVGVRSNKFNK